MQAPQSTVDPAEIEKFQAMAAEWWNLRSGQPVESGSRKRFPPTEKDL